MTSEAGGLGFRFTRFPLHQRGVMDLLRIECSRALRDAACRAAITRMIGNSVKLTGTYQWNRAGSAGRRTLRGCEEAA